MIYFSFSDQTPSPYGGNYNAFGFYRNIQSSPSPQPQPTPSPPSNFAVGGTWTGSNVPNAIPVQPLLHPPLAFEGMPNPMNIHPVPPQAVNLGASDANTLSNLLMDLDSQQFTQLSGDMSGLSSLLEVFQSNAEDGNKENNERVMTDSFSKLFSWGSKLKVSKTLRKRCVCDDQMYITLLCLRDEFINVIEYWWIGAIIIDECIYVCEKTFIVF